MGEPAWLLALPQASHSHEQVALTLLVSVSSCHAVGLALESFMRHKRLSEATSDCSLISPGSKGLVGTFGKDSVNATELGDFN